jgi:hypothetical protein
MCGRATTSGAASLLASAVLLSATLCSVNTWAAEQPPARAQADELMRQGVELRRQGRNTEALEIFLKAQAIAPSASVLAQIGSVELSLGRWVDAETHLEQALARHDPPWTDSSKNREMLEKMLADARKRIARLDVRGTAGAGVAIDGRQVGALPLPAAIHVTAGTIRLMVTAPGRQPLERTVTLVGGEEATVVAELALLPPQAPPPTTAAIAPRAAPATEARQGVRWRRWVGGALAVAGVTAIATGITWIAMDGRTSCNAPPGGFCELVYDTNTQGWVALGVGAVAAAGGATLYFWKREENRIGLAVAPSGLAVHGHF